MVFRGDIEGLRGIAVLLVVLAHAGVAWLPGGFVGVDIFFVISGYLITARLATELQATELQARQRIDFWAFYARRVRRLFPALAVMLVLASMAGFLLLPIESWPAQADSARWAALWLSNVHFASASFGYFDEGASASLFLHTWSLAVEEQFYLLWPLLLLFAWRWRGVRGLVCACWSLTALGFALAVAMTWAMPVQAYYQMPARLWQLSLGAAVYLSLGHRTLPAPFARVTRAVGGLGLLAAALWLSPERIVYPGAWVLLPSVGAALLLLSGPAGGWLEQGPLRFIGRLSYSWYLWHWPTMVLAFALAGRSVENGLVAGIVSLGLAWLSWRWVERPLLGLHIGDGRRWVLVGLLGSAVLAGLALAWERHAVAIMPQREVHPLRSTLSLPDLYRQRGCDDWYRADRVVPCTLVTQQHPARPTIVLVGDSVAAQWSPALQEVARDARWNLVVFTKSSCPMIAQSFVYPVINRRYVECERWRGKVLARVRGMQPEVLLLGSSAAYDFTPEQWETGTRTVLARLDGAAGRTLLLAPTPLLSFDGPRCATTRDSLAARLGANPDCTEDLTHARATAITERLRAAAAGSAGIRVLDLANDICMDGVCRAERDGVLVYRDTQHLNATFVRGLAPVFARQPEFVALRGESR